MGNSGKPRRGPAGSGTCISHSSPLAFPQLPAGISWNTQPRTNLKSSKKLHKAGGGFGCSTSGGLGLGMESGNSGALGG